MPNSVWEGMEEGQQAFLERGVIRKWGGEVGFPGAGDGFPNIVNLFKKLPEDDDPARNAAGDQLTAAMKNGKLPNVDFAKNLNAVLDSDTQDGIAKAMQENPEALNKAMPELIKNVKAGNAAGVDGLLNKINTPAATVEKVVEKNEATPDDNCLPGEVPAEPVDVVAGSNGITQKDQPETENNAQTVPEEEAHEAGSSTGLPAEITSAAGFDEFIDNLGRPEAEGGLGLGQEVLGLLAGGGAGAEGGAGFIDSLKDQLKENPSLFEDMNGVIGDADASQRAGFKEHFQTVFAASGKGGDAMDMALADLQGYARGVGMANSPLGGMLGGLVEKFLPGIMKMLNGLCGSLGIAGGASGLLSSFGFGDSFMEGLTGKGAAGGQNLTESQQQVLNGAEKFLEQNGQEIDGFMVGLDNKQAALLAATLDPKADGTVGERLQAFEDSLSGLQKGTWEKWKGEGREIIAQDPELANSEFAKLLEASDALPPSEPVITAAEFGADLTGEQMASLGLMVNAPGNQQVFEDHYQKFWDGLSEEQQQDWVKLVGEEPNYGEIAQAGREAIAGKTDQVTSGQQKNQEHKGQEKDPDQENGRNREHKDESELDKDNGIGNDDRNGQIAAYEQDFKNFTNKGDLYGGSSSPEGDGKFEISAGMGARGPVQLANGNIISIGVKDGAPTSDINKPDPDLHKQNDRSYTPGGIA